MIRSVVRCVNNMVLAFDENGEQIPAYQGQYEEVREKILREAPLSAEFHYLPDMMATVDTSSTGVGVVVLASSPGNITLS